MQRVLRNLQISSKSAVPDHLQIAGQIEQLIRTGALKEGERLPPTMDLVRSWGVNISRIQRAMEILTLQGLLQRFPRRGTFVLPQAVRASVGILVGPDLLLEQCHFYRVLATALRNEVKDKGLNPRIYDALASPDSDEGRRSRSEIQYDLDHQRYSGFLVTGGGMTEQVIPASHRELPFVLFSTTRMQVDVHIDNHDFIASATRWLIQNGCRKLACIYNFLPEAQQFQKEAAAAGLTVPDYAMLSGDSFISYLPQDSHFPNDRLAYEGMSRVLKQWHRRNFFPDGILIPDDIMARGVAVAVLAASSQPPPKMIVLTVEGIEHFYAMPMTRYSISAKEIASRLMRRLANRIIGEPVSTEPELVQGKIV